MQEFMARLVDVPMARMFVLTGLVFLLVAVLGKIEGKIEPGNVGRIAASVVGLLLLAGGLGMYFVEGDMIRSAPRPGFAIAPAAPHAAPDKGIVREANAAPRNAASVPIQVVSATYGKSCGAKPGNATAQLARACDGRSVCEYRHDAAGAEDASPECEKDFAAEWKCGTSASVYALSVGPGAVRSERVRLACSGG